ncbi:MAG: alpha/beta fold hydrolase [Anaerolineales bacterium]|nr:alpha/beta fold hydrolase [Anaerolineales bacterium]
MHGMNDSSRSWSLMLPYMGNKYHIYALDLRGHGDTDKAVSGYAPQDMAGDVIAFMDALKIEKASFVGHSMGSNISQYLVIDHPERINKVVLIGTFAQGSADASTDKPEITEWWWTTISTLPEPIEPNSEFMVWWGRVLQLQWMKASCLRFDRGGGSAFICLESYNKRTHR